MDRKIVKDILDRECKDRQHSLKGIYRCPYYNNIPAELCWTCHENDKLTAEILDTELVGAIR